MNTKKIIVFMVLVVSIAPAWGSAYVKRMGECIGTACKNKIKEITNTTEAAVVDDDVCANAKVKIAHDIIINEITADYLAEQTRNIHRPLNTEVRNAVDNLIEMNACKCQLFTPKEQENVRTYIGTRFGRPISGADANEIEAKQRNERKYKDRLYQCTHGITIEE